jgi:hypothetical protein
MMLQIPAVPPLLSYATLCSNAPLARSVDKWSVSSLLFFRDTLLQRPGSVTSSAQRQR